MNRYIIPCLIIMALIFNACSNTEKSSTEPATIIRYEQDLFGINTNNIKHELKSLQSQYPVFLGGDLEDEANLTQISDYLDDPMIREFYKNTQNKYPTLEKQKQDFGILKERYRNEFPDAPEFTIYTYISGLDFNHPIVFLDSIMLVALDMYLNPGFDHYDKLGIPRYISRRFVEENIIRDAAEAIIRGFVAPPSDNRILSEMIAEGKVLFAIEQLVPHLADNIIINYTVEQYKWCTNHEKMLWAFMLKNDFLFTSDTKRKQEFLLESPSTPEFGDDAPARLGQYLGWQIIKAYHKKHPEASLQQILEYQDESELMQHAGYKP